MSEDSRKKFFSGAVVDAAMQKDFNTFNSLLARGKSSNVKERNQGYLVSGLLSFFKGKQKKLQQKLLKNLTGLDAAFKEESTSRQTIYDKENENRDFYDKYLKNPEQGIVDYAEMIYNNDESIKQSNVTFKNKSELTDPNAKFLADQLWEESKKQAKIELEAMKDNPLITSRTFQEYNKAYDDAYKAEYARLENDPTQSSLLASAANSIFPSWFDDRKAKLQSSVDKANFVVEMQEEEELFNPAVASYLAAQPKLDKTRALEFINTNYEDKVSPEILNQMEQSITKMKGEEGITSDEILGIALSKVNLNRNNKDEFTKKIETAQRLFDERWKRSPTTGGVIPQEGDDLFAAYKEESKQFINLMVLEPDEKIRKVALTVMKLNSPSTDPKLIPVLERQLVSYTPDQMLESTLQSATLYLNNPANESDIQATINYEKDLDNPRFKDKTSFEEFYYKNLMSNHGRLLEIKKARANELRNIDKQ
tara:strand:- start:6110 stop:7549 length:1440 start_codon:yes stop_codon:yes gene_type:complete